MKCHKIDGNVTFVRLGDSKPKTKLSRIEINKIYSKLNHEAIENAKKDYCYLCGEKCTSFRNSHSIPKFILSHISQKGQLLSYIRREMSPEKRILEKITLELFSLYAKIAKIVFFAIMSKKRHI